MAIFNTYALTGESYSMLYEKIVGTEIWEMIHPEIDKLCLEFPFSISFSRCKNHSLVCYKHIPVYVDRKRKGFFSGFS
jgi:NifB/MoaA-like Fe-S oxidoreductase